MAISSCEEAQRLLDIFGISNIHLTKLQVELSVDEVVSVHLTITPTKEQYAKLCEVIADINKPTFTTRVLEPKPLTTSMRVRAVERMYERIPTKPELIDTPTLVPHEM